MPWHADRHYWQTCTSDRMLTAFIPFHDCGEQMGTITMIDGSHLWKDIPGDDSTRHFAQRDRSELEELLHKTAEFNGAEVNADPDGHTQGPHELPPLPDLPRQRPQPQPMPRRAISFHLQDGENQWRAYHKAGRHHGRLQQRRPGASTPSAGTPDYADPDYCPVIWQS